jgi:hypothetical protein
MQFGMNETQPPGDSPPPTPSYARMSTRARYALPTVRHSSRPLASVRITRCLVGGVRLWKARGIRISLRTILVEWIDWDHHAHDRRAREERKKSHRKRKTREDDADLIHHAHGVLRSAALILILLSSSSSTALWAIIAAILLARIRLTWVTIRLRLLLRLADGMLWLLSVVLLNGCLAEDGRILQHRLLVLRLGLLLLQYREIFDVRAFEHDELVDVIRRRHESSAALSILSALLRAEASYVLQCDGAVLRVDRVEDALVPQVQTRHQRDASADVRDAGGSGRLHRRRRILLLLLRLRWRLIPAVLLLLLLIGVVRRLVRLRRVRRVPAIWMGHGWSGDRREAGRRTQREIGSDVQ